MTKRPTPPKRPGHCWDIYRVRGTPAQFIGSVDGAPDAQSAIKQAIEQFEIGPQHRDRLIAQRRD
jgi:hypothetical protein